MSEIRAGLNKSSVVVAAELLRTLRDPHVIAYLVSPIALYPLLVWVVLAWSSVDAPRDDADPPRITARAPADVEQALRAQGLRLVAPEGQPDLVLEHSDSGRGVGWTVRLESQTPRARRGLGLVEDAAAQVSNDSLVRALEAAGVPRPTSFGVVALPVGGAEAYLRGGGGLLVAYVAVFAMLFSGLYPAIDVVVAEREHQTVDALWLVPVPRWSLLFGKVAACSILTALVGAGHFAGASLTIARVAAEEAPMLSLAPVWASVALAVPPAFSAACLISCAHVFTALFARTYKEGELLGTVVVLGATVPCSIVLLRLASGASEGLAMVPLGNTVWALQQAFAGTLTVGPSLLVAGLNLGGAAVILSGIVRFGGAGPALLARAEGAGR